MNAHPPCAARRDYGGYQNGARSQGFAYAAQNRRALAPCAPFWQDEYRDGRLRRDEL